MRQGMQDVGEDQLLMLLLVMETDLENPQRLRALVLGNTGDEALNRGIDMSPVVGDRTDRRPAQQPASRPRMPRTRRHIVGIEQIAKVFVEDPIARKVRNKEKLLEEPGRMRTMPLGRARIGHRLDHLVLGTERRGADISLGAHGPEGVGPCRARIVHMRCTTTLRIELNDR